MDNAAFTMTAELRLLGRLMRHARANGYECRRDNSGGVTYFRWRNSPARRDVSAMGRPFGWAVHVRAKGDFYPDSSAELADVLVAVGYLPAEFRSSTPVDMSQAVKCEAPQTLDCRRPVTHIAEYYTGQTANVGGKTEQVTRRVHSCASCIDTMPFLVETWRMGGAR